MGQPLALLLTLVSDGPGCLTTAARRRAEHGGIVTGGSASGVSRPQLCAVSTVLSNPKTALMGNFHSP